MEIKLSKSRLATLAKIKDVKARTQLRDQWIAEIEAKQAERQVYLDSLKGRVLEYGTTPNGAVFIKNTGTRHNFAVFSPERARQFVAEFKQFKALVDGLPGSEE